MPSDKAGRGRFWQIFILSVVTLFLCAMTVTLTTAVRGVTRVVDPDYYDHGLHYGRDGEKLGNAEKLGWRMATTVSENRLEIRVTDAEDNPVGGGRVTFALDDADSNKAGRGRDAWAGAGDPVVAEKAPGVYSIMLDKGGASDVKAKILFTKGDAALSGRLVVLR